MARGYWGPRNIAGRCCHPGPKDKFWCQACDHVAKAPLGATPHCPFCRNPMLNMGHRWRPGKKGRRGRVRVRNHGWPSRHQVLTPEEYAAAAAAWRRQGSREQLALRLLKRWGG